MDSDYIMPRPKRHHLLLLPPEIRLLIYKAVFEYQVYPIRRRPIPLRCLVDNRCLMAQRDLMGDISPRVCSHPECQRIQQQTLDTDIYVGNGVLIASSHYPCPHFANFTYCLKHWQADSLANLAFRIPLRQGMETYLAEWNETLSLVSLGFPGLSAISIEIHVQYPPLALGDTFWDASLLELDRLNLKGINLVIYEGTETAANNVFFKYSAGTLPRLMVTTPAPPGLPVSFRHARDALRHEKNAPVNHGPGRLFFRLSPNLFPLYVRSLIHLLPWRGWTQGDVRQEDRYQRIATYEYAYANDDEEHRRPIFGFQFNRQLKDDNQYIARGLAKLRESRQRLEQLYEREPPESCIPLRRGITKPKKETDPRYSRYASLLSDADGGTNCRVERPGDWRRQLIEESYAPFIESFPMSVARKLPHPESKCASCPDGDIWRLRNGEQKKSACVLGRS
ncbi:uncharacterized protein BDW43DRAFT_296368 [Aspergillus alliaceus]|uniref:uncharacterized protein n=1 Tax=Petromyces alliaceus TaxID=209559 RepID=UPI0012A3F284|nr:uncharacterized protein BDW43DRAFT_296368 [Aspergillus alliaceus]KAB8238997.1 hypothetical protein BDW43DRAFT_296368 [Aspergillus alliaceus]